MEELLNKLIEKGRVPFGLEGVNKVKYAEQYYRNYSYVFYGGGWQQWRSIRQIVSKESGLWQFVCENKLVKDLNQKYTENDLFNYYQDNYHYWLIKSALCDEDKLEKFLLDNIKIDD